LDRLDPADVEPDAGIELEGTATGRRLRVAEHHTDLLAQLVGEDQRRVRAADGAGQLAQRLTHESSLDPDERIAHLAFDLGTRNERSNRVDDHAVDATGTDQRLGDLERLLAGVGLADEKLVDVDATGTGVTGIESVLDIDERGHPALLLGLGDGVLAKRRLTRRLRTEDLGDPPPLET